MVELLGSGTRLKASKWQPTLSTRSKKGLEFHAKVLAGVCRESVSLPRLPSAGTGE